MTGSSFLSTFLVAYTATLSSEAVAQFHPRLKCSLLKNQPQNTQFCAAAVQQQLDNSPGNIQGCECMDFCNVAGRFQPLACDGQRQQDSSFYRGCGQGSLVTGCVMDDAPKPIGGGSMETSEAQGAGGGGFNPRLQCLVGGNGPLNVDQCKAAVDRMSALDVQRAQQQCGNGSSCLNFCNVAGRYRYRGCNAGETPASIGCFTSLAVLACQWSDGLPKAQMATELPPPPPPPTYAPPSPPPPTPRTNPSNWFGGQLTPNQGGSTPNTSQAQSSGCRDGSKKKSKKKSKKDQDCRQPSTSGASGPQTQTTTPRPGNPVQSNTGDSWTVIINGQPVQSGGSSTPNNTPPGTASAGGPSFTSGNNDNNNIPGLGQTSGNTAQSSHTDPNYRPPANAFNVRPKNPGQSNKDAVLGSSGSVSTMSIGAVLRTTVVSFVLMLLV